MHQSYDSDVAIVDVFDSNLRYGFSIKQQNTYPNVNDGRQIQLCL